MINDLNKTSHMSPKYNGFHYDGVHRDLSGMWKVWGLLLPEYCILQYDIPDIRKTYDVVATPINDC